MVSKSRSQVKGHLGQGHTIFRIQGRCKIDQLDGTESFVAIGRFLRELFVKNIKGVASTLSVPH